MSGASAAVKAQIALVELQALQGLGSLNIPPTLDLGSIVDQINVLVNNLNSVVQYIPYLADPNNPTRIPRFERWLTVVTQSISIYHEKIVPLYGPGHQVSLESTTVPLTGTTHSGAVILAASDSIADVQAQILGIQQFMRAVSPPQVQGLYKLVSQPASMSYALNRSQKPQNTTVGQLFQPIGTMAALASGVASTLPKSPASAVTRMVAGLNAKADALDALATQIEGTAAQLEAMSNLQLYVYLFDSLPGALGVYNGLLNAEGAPKQKYCSGVMVLGGTGSLDILRGLLS